MKNPNIFSVSLKNLMFRRDSWKTNVDGGLLQKGGGGLGQFANLREGGLSKKRGGDIFEGGLYSNAHYRDNTDPNGGGHLILGA